jgi:pimeloyl-ACP methyl ester carboxylesterase
MTEHMSGEPDADDRFVRLDDGDMHVVEDGKPGAPALLLIHGSAGSLASWDAVVPSLAGAFRVIRVDLLGCGKSATPRAATTSLLRPAVWVPRWISSA